MRFPTLSKQFPTGSRQLLSLLAAGFLIVGCGDSAESLAPTSDTGRPTFLNWDPAVAHVGMAKCQSCHLGIHSTYGRTGMGRAFYPMSDAEIVEDFHEENTFSVPETGLHYRMVKRDGKFYQQQFLLDADGGEMAFDERELILVVGSNNHSRSYITMIGDKMFQAPACWYPQESKWELCPGYEFKNDHFGREISLDCLHCHNGRMEPVEGERNEFHKPYPHGIGCERCHGPGQLHVDRWSSGDEEPRGEADWTIVNPRRLERRQRVEICYQCHLGDAKATIRVARYDREMRDYRPGQPIADYVVPFFYAHPTQWEFGLSSQADRMLQSRCFKESGGRLECLTCHNPHVPVYEQSVDDFYRQKCLSCHSQEDCGLEHAAARRTDKRDDCVACHMRRAQPDDQRFTEFTDHWIRKEIELEQRDHREDYSIIAAFPEQLASYPAGEQAYYRGRANFLLAMDVPEPRRPPMWDEAERWFGEAIAQGFDNANSQFFLGKTRVYKGNQVGALEAFERAVGHDPAHHDANLALGQTWVQTGDLNAGGTVFRGMLERDPDDPMALAEYARVAWTQQRYDEALRFYQRAAEQEPWNPTLQLNLGMSLASLQRFAEAAEAGELATILDPDNSNTWNLYFNAMREAGHGDLASEGRRQFERMRSVNAGAE